MSFLQSPLDFKRNWDMGNFSAEVKEEDLEDDVGSGSDSDVDLDTRSTLVADAKVDTGPPIKKRRKVVDTVESEPTITQLSTSPDCSPPAQLVQVVSSVSISNEEDKMFLLSLLPQLMEMTATEKLDFKINVLKLLKTSAENKEKERSEIKGKGR
uniref:BESS domain-containing protein n=1 Tax=Graphocephala atropunctata TaxID=36148 RepID=A0A1B6M2N8_9HEMI